MNARQLPLYLLHVPKCAGISVVAYVSPSFTPDEICPTEIHGEWRWDPAQVPHYKFYAGHFSMDFVRALGRPGTLLLMLRHPLTRALSLYDYWRSYRWEFINEFLPPYPNCGPAVAKRFGLSEFLEQPFPIDKLYNACTRQILGSRFEELMPDESATIAAATDALQTFDWIGLVETFDQSIARLGALLDLPVPQTLPRENDTASLAVTNPAFEPVEKTRPTDAERHRIEDLNRIDLAVYEAAAARAHQGTPA